MFLELPQVGPPVQAGEEFGEVESVKAVSPLYSPVTGEVVEVNADLPDQLEVLNQDPYGAGWIAKIRITDDSSLAEADGLRRLPEAMCRSRPLRDELAGHAFHASRSNHALLVQHSDDQQAMLDAIGAASLDELFRVHPAGPAAAAPAGPAAGAERAGADPAHDGAGGRATRHAGQKVCFLGGGSYDHFVPAVVDAWPPAASSTPPTRPTSRRSARARCRRCSSTRR